MAARADAVGAAESSDDDIGLDLASGMTKETLELARRAAEAADGATAAASEPSEESGEAARAPAHISLGDALIADAVAAESATPEAIHMQTGLFTDCVVVVVTGGRIDARWQRFAHDDITRGGGKVVHRLDEEDVTHVILDLVDRVEAAGWFEDLGIPQRGGAAYGAVNTPDPMMTQLCTVEWFNASRKYGVLMAVPYPGDEGVPRIGDPDPENRFEYLWHPGLCDERAAARAAAEAAKESGKSEEVAAPSFVERPSSPSGRTVGCWIVRHGERIDETAAGATWMADAGAKWFDPPLTEAGKAQARGAAQQLREVHAAVKFTCIYVSPLERTLMTAAAMAEIMDLPLKVVPGLCTCAAAVKRRGYHKLPILKDNRDIAKLLGPHVKLLPPERRVRGFEQTCESLCANTKDSHILIVTHREGIRDMSQVAGERVRDTPYCCIAEFGYSAHRRHKWDIHRVIRNGGRKEKRGVAGKLAKKAGKQVRRAKRAAATK